MNRLQATLLLVAAIVVTACDGGQANAAGEPGFRVRADVSTPLNADAGWAGALNEPVTMAVDRPFRLRIEAALPAAATSQPLQLQYRRNGGEWFAVGAHDFPYPEREIEVDFADAEAGSTPAGWRVVTGAGADLTAAADADASVLRATAGDEPLVGLYQPPWDLEEFSFGVQFRLPDGGQSSVGIVFGYVNADNYWKVVFDAAAGRVRASRLVDGEETVLVERSAGVVAGKWQEAEVNVEAGLLEVNFEDDALVFVEPVGDSVPMSDPGFYVPASSSADFRAFVVEGRPASPPVSIIETDVYQHGDATDDLLKASAARFTAGAGISMAAHTPAWDGADGHGEFEWPLVIRRFADRAITSDDGDTFEFRMTGTAGTAIDSPTARLTLDVPPGHLGGTFVETPGRIGPWQTSNGDLYFVMEPTESDNLFMIVKSTDGGQSWTEVDGANRPKTGDLESVDGQMVDGTIHMVHQVTGATLHHAFRTSDHPARPDSWAVTDELATKVTARAQMASMAARSDGSLVFFHLGDTVGYAVRSPDGEWSDEILIDYGNGAPDLAGPQATAGIDDIVHLGYYRMDGTIWYRRLLADGTLTDPHQLATGAATSEDDWGPVLPLVYLPETDTTVVIYRLDDGKLWERRVSGDELPTPAVQVTDQRVVQHAVDSQQAGADAVADGATVRVLFISEADGNIYSTHDRGGWQPPELEVDGIDGGWVRGSIYVRPDGVKVYGYAYDSGSQGGAGFNRYAEIVLDD